MSNVYVTLTTLCYWYARIIFRTLQLEFKGGNLTRTSAGWRAGHYGRFPAITSEGKFNLKCLTMLGKFSQAVPADFNHESVVATYVEPSDSQLMLHEATPSEVTIELQRRYHAKLQDCKQKQKEAEEIIANRSGENTDLLKARLQEAEEQKRLHNTQYQELKKDLEESRRLHEESERRHQQEREEMMAAIRSLQLQQQTQVRA